ncbi:MULTISPECIES: hypothetical protein [Nocardia]|uniref:Integral membrane protein n=2 Tax=Nocardia TaxID=1817 RepID=A0ABU6B240_9NOCA|nr:MULTISPECIES: hypothetical protein [unclassified Nocardia]MEA3530312.1 hypothetical protein [Nocardia sp. CDC192]MEB3513828.1 hypothetical protein [Nocardia sp. CDC186]
MRGLSGIVAGGTVVGMLIVVGAAVIAQRRGFPGPGGESVAWHVAAAVVALGAQIYSDRHRGWAAFAGSMVVFLAAGLLLWTQWWS